MYIPCVYFNAQELKSYVLKEKTLYYTIIFDILVRDVVGHPFKTAAQNSCIKVCNVHLAGKFCSRIAFTPTSQAQSFSEDLNLTNICMPYVAYSKVVDEWTIRLHEIHKALESLHEM